MSTATNSNKHSPSPAPTSPVDRLLEWRRSHPEEYRAKRIAGLKASPKAVAAARMVGLKYKTKRLASRAKNPRSAKGEVHALSLIWRLCDPIGRTYVVKNLAEFVRNNASLFEPHETQWTRQQNNGAYRCLAYSGLATLRPRNRKGRPHRRIERTWHGWTWHD